MMNTTISPASARRSMPRATSWLAVGAVALLFAAGACSKDDAKDKAAPADKADKADKTDKTDDKMDHGKMDHGKMDHGKMDHGKMDMAKDGREVAIKVDGEGFHPSSIPAKPSEPLKLVFTRVSEEGCGTEVVLADSGKKYELPLNKPVDVHLIASKQGSVEFACGMNMLKGSIVVQN